MSKNNSPICQVKVFWLVAYWLFCSRASWHDWPQYTYEHTSHFMDFQLENHIEYPMFIFFLLNNKHVSMKTIPFLLQIFSLNFSWLLIMLWTLSLTIWAKSEVLRTYLKLSPTGRSALDQWGSSWILMMNFPHVLKVLFLFYKTLQTLLFRIKH